MTPEGRVTPAQMVERSIANYVRDEKRREASRYVQLIQDYMQTEKNAVAKKSLRELLKAAKRHLETL